MISSNSYVQNILKQNRNVKMTLGCTFEYNMNMLTNLSESSITGPSYATPGNKDAFRKIFPIDTIIRPRRPDKAGVKYAILGDVAGEYSNPRNLNYPYKYRTYYPGIDTVYKYWLSNKGQGGTITITYPKTIVTNKIVVKFEISHAVPPTWSVYGTPSGGSETLLKSGTSSDIPSFVSTSNNAGVLILYYTGSQWTTDESLHNTASYVSLTSLKLIFGAVADKYIGIMEVSPRWVIDISDKIQSTSIQKEASDSSTDLSGSRLPVGNVTANNIDLSILDYNESVKQIKEYERSNSSAIDPTKIYLYKEIEVKPYFKIFHDNGSLGTSPNKYDKIKQGVFYIDSYSIDEIGKAEISALDGAKILQETSCPNILCEGYAATAIIRRLLDNIGFTNYNFNLTANDQSVIVPNYWWCDLQKSVWNAIQELCLDTQMTAVFDENGILQFYSREYMYTSRSIDWTFTSETIDSTTLPNIKSLNKKSFPAVNQVKIRWQSVTTSNYDSNKNSFILWRSPVKTLSAAALVQDLDPIDVQNGVVSGGNPTQYITLLSTTGLDTYALNTKIEEYNTYLAVGEEIIEIDAIEYAYVPIEGGNKVVIDATSETDVAKYKALSKPGAENFQPTGRYRIKNRKALGTSFPKDSNGNATKHYAGGDNQLNEWKPFEVTYK